MPISVKVFEFSLTSEGYSVLEADCGKQGLSLLNSNIDLVILDIMMPEYPVLSPVKKSAKYQMYRYSFLTTKAQESDRIIRADCRWG